MFYTVDRKKILKICFKVGKRNVDVEEKHFDFNSNFQISKKKLSNILTAVL